MITQKNSDLQFMNKMLDNYKNLLIRIQKECSSIGNETTALKNMLHNDNVSDNQLVNNLVHTLRERQSAKSSLMQELVKICTNLGAKNENSSNLLQQEQNENFVLEKKIKVLEDELAQANFNTQQAQIQNGPTIMTKQAEVAICENQAPPLFEEAPPLLQEEEPQIIACDFGNPEPQ